MSSAPSLRSYSKKLKMAAIDSYRILTERLTVETVVNIAASVVPGHWSERIVVA